MISRTMTKKGQVTISDFVYEYVELHDRVFITRNGSICKFQDLTLSATTRQPPNLSNPSLIMPLQKVGLGSMSMPSIRDKTLWFKPAIVDRGSAIL